jgi:N-acetylmuramoyl-L-alanine amidase
MTWSQRGLRWAVLPLLVALSGAPAYARVHHSDAWARDHFAAAERMREALNGRPQTERTRRDYQRVINAYRYVYFGAPASSKADPSVVAVAETLVEMGRRFDDDKILNEAIAQYKFLRKEYPGSKYRCDALFTIGEIYKDDLNDPEQARTVFREFVHRYPHNRLVEDAQQAVIEIDRQAAAEKKAQKNGAKETASRGKGAQDSLTKATSSKGDTTEDTGSKSAAAKDKNDKNDDAQADAAQADDTHADAGSGDSSDTDDSAHKSGRLPRVTGIRHWSTPDYTRVAIDLESEIKYGSQRIANPDRIFFDLRDTKLASTLVGKSFDVDDGFLKKIRVAQFAPGRTRVVLEVDSLSDYEAFLLPNPYRLIIDIHGKGDKAAHARPTKEQEAALADAEAPPKTSSKPDVPKSVLKADVKALSGKAVSKKEEIHDQPKADDEKVGDHSSSANANNDDAPEKSKTTEVDVKTPTGTIKKVIVPADDDDDTTPVEAANADAPKRDVPKADVQNRSRLKPAGKAAPVTSVSVKDEHSRDDDSTVADDTATVNPPVAHHVRGKSSSRMASNRAADLDVREAKPTASGDRSLIRALGLKIGKIVIDPGHGGHDTGTIGPNGLEEKDLVLEVGRRLGKLLETRLGAEVVYTRKDDTFIPLETRTAIANQQRADLFISIHANSSHDPAARGVETYYLNFTSSPEALEVAARENAVSEKSIYELQDLVKKIALKEKIEESREFAGDVQESLHSGLAAKSPAIRDRGVKKAPFIVLIGANMPSILAEISFVSNPADEHRLETSEYRQRIAESLYRGISKYVNGLSGVKVASKIDRDAGQ